MRTTRIKEVRDKSFYLLSYNVILSQFVTFPLGDPFRVLNYPGNLHFFVFSLSKNKYLVDTYFLST